MIRPESALRRWCLSAALLIAALLVVPASARADLVTVRGGRVIKVAGVRFEATEVVLLLRGGGEMRAPLDFVIDVQPDEVPWPEPPAPDADAADLDTPASTPEPTRDGLHGLIDRLAIEFGVDARLAHAVIQVESNYRAEAVSPKGAMGLMQLMPATARQYDVHNPFDPEQNLTAGLRHLRGLLDRYGAGRVSLALAAYNAGEGAVSRHKGIPPFPETRQYVQRVLALARQ